MRFVELIFLLWGFQEAWSMSLEEYMTLRKSYFEAENELSFGADLIFDARESQANAILMRMKSQEYKAGLESNGEYFPAAHHFFHAHDAIEASTVFKIIRILPKGAALHMHDFTVGPSDYVAFELTKWENLYYCLKDGDHLIFHFYPEQPEEVCNSVSGMNWTLVKDLRNAASSPELLNLYFSKQMSMVTPTPELDYKDDNEAWYNFEKKISTIASLVNYEPAFRDYYYKTLSEFYEDNVMYIEMRGLYNEVYRLNGSVLSPLEVVGLQKEIISTFMEDHPKFWGAKIIYAPHRFQSASEIGERLAEALEMKEQYPSVFAGFDLVGQEDKGSPLLNFIPELLEAQANGLNFFFHSGETTWQGTPIDENLFDAILLNTTRIGHGYALAHHPYLLQLAAERGVAVELCPISNQVLNLVKDLRNHPGKELLQNGFPVVVASDGPGIWGSYGLSHDWYYAFMAIGGSRADLKFLKQLAINSILYSAMNTNEKASALLRFDETWSNAIDYILETYGSK